MKPWLSILTILALVQPALGQSVLESSFGFSMPLPSGQTIEQNSTNVPLLPDTCYTWRLRLSKAKGTVAVTEVLRLPKPAETWNTEAEQTEVSSDQSEATTALSLVPDNGWISHGWCVAEGDPAGAYRIEVSRGDTLLHAFDFQLQPAP